MLRTTNTELQRVWESVRAHRFVLSLRDLSTQNAPSLQSDISSAWSTQPCGRGFAFLLRASLFDKICWQTGLYVSSFVVFLLSLP